MALWIALFRGINVGGKNKLPMATLKEILHGIGCDNVQTYIQSGNALLESKTRSSRDLANRIEQAIQEATGIDTFVLLLKAKELKDALDANPFPQADKDPKSIHFLFLAKNPKAPDLGRLDDLQGKTEKYQLLNRVFYLFAPDGIARSKLAVKAESVLGVCATGRNLNTVHKLVDMIDAG